jgi:hypothetical protein
MSSMAESFSPWFVGEQAANGFGRVYFCLQ